MLKVVNTKLLIAIRAALVAISAVLFRIEQQHAAEARRQAEIQKQDEQFRADVEAKKKKSQANPGNESKTWTKSY